MTWLTTQEYYVPYFDFIEQCLGLFKQNDFSFMCPLNCFERSVLTELENYSLSRNRCSIPEFYKQVRQDYYQRYPNMCLPFSEFEIYGTFATQVLNKKFQYRSSNFTVTHDVATALLTTNNSVVLKGYDSMIDDSAWSMIEALSV